MKMVFLTPEQFDTFSYNHPLHSFYQTTMYGNLMTKYNYKVEYFGFIDGSNKLVAASLILSQKAFGNHLYGYAPRGFLVDYDNKNLVKEITDLFKNYFDKRKYVFLKIDPIVVNNKRDHDGNIIPSPYSNDLIPYLKSIGYAYFGENRFFGTLKPRWNAVLKITGSTPSLFKNFDNQVRNKIRKAQSRGIEIFQGNTNDIKNFYEFVSKKHYRKLDYYQNFAMCFKDKFEIYFAKLNPQIYLVNVKKLYELELTKNENLNNEVQEKTNNNSVNEKLMNTKLYSDKLLSIYKKELEFASELFDKKPNGIVIGATAIVLDKNGIELLIEGQNSEYGLYYPLYLLKWHILDKYAKKGAIYFDLNAITGYFGDNSRYRGLNETKLGFNAEVTEYIGEFDLIIKRKAYEFYCKGKFWNKKMHTNAK